MGLRYGTMSRLWPRIPLMWLDLSDWMQNKKDWPSCTDKAKISSIKNIIRESKRLLKWATKEKEALDRKIKSIKDKNLEESCPCLGRLQFDLLQREGEIKGLK